MSEGTPETNAKNCVDMAISMHRDIFKVKTRAGESVHMRIGCHTGTIVGGCIGTKKIRFDIWYFFVFTIILIEGVKTRLLQIC